MQLVLPSFHLPEKIQAGKATLATFCAINDLSDDLCGTQCTWQLTGNKNVISSTSFPIDIPADGISENVKVTLPSLSNGLYRLNVTLSSGSKILGDNSYEIQVDD